MNDKPRRRQKPKPSEHNENAVHLAGETLARIESFRDMVMPKLKAGERLTKEDIKIIEKLFQFWLEDKGTQLQSHLVKSIVALLN